MTAELSIFDTPPGLVQAELDQLKAGLDSELPRKELDHNLLIATWNIRAFGSVTKKWTAAGSNSPKRDYRGLRAVIEIVSRFDVVAIQEVTGNLRALRYMMKYLGPDWGFLMTDVTLGDAGHNERMAFVYDRRRVQPSGLAAELVVQPEWLDEIAADALTRQFARTPYAVSFKSGSQTFILASLHIAYGDASGRVPELKAIARWMEAWATRINRWHQNFLVLGDFNIDRRGDDLWQAFTSTGLTVPDELHSVRRSIFDVTVDPLDKYYDQIAWFETGSGSRRLNMEYSSAGGFDFLPYMYTDLNLSKTSLSYRLSDHYPLWAEFLL
jgi:endonuclease/exonuclease/phosphatase family metal-dependent hydrolase